LLGQDKKITFLLVQQAQRGRFCQQHSADYVGMAVQEVGLGGEKNFGDKAIDR
jgi:hypothetical protein